MRQIIKKGSMRLADEEARSVFFGTQLYCLLELVLIK